ncbi:hypothetical protein LINGRAHAP2_LOCUS5246 [Linum grandiflorum]
MVGGLDLQGFIVRARVLKLYRQALRVARRAPVHSRVFLILFISEYQNISGRHIHVQFVRT